MAGATGVVLACAMAGLAQAQTRSIPRSEASPAPSGDGGDVVFGGSYFLNLQLDRTLNKSAGVRPFSNLFFELDDLNWYLNIGQYFSLNGGIKMDQVRTVSKSSAFRAEGLRVDELYATVYLDPFRFYGGKIHPRFGKAWDIMPGLYGTDFAEDYELEEKIGIGAAFDFRDPLLGRHTLAFETFFEDTTPLSNSLFSRPRITDPDVIRPRRLRRSDGGVGNTGTLFDNFTVTLDGGRIADLRGFSYNIGYEQRRGSKVGGEPTERGFVAGINWEFPITRRITMTPLLEFAYQHNPGGVAGHTKWLTAGLAFELGMGWTTSLYGTLRPVKDKTIPDSYTDHLIGFSVAYDLGTLLKREVRWLNGLGIEAGYKHERVARDSLNTVGVSLNYERRF
ncbi:hypothetical protein [Vineibacter terrae]|uniref:hypothetical protein n=1 Tax=Vineibacter terrae TaxID=2586908 RepID=UPI002E3785D9|nr:hypothetical protein [Vineibacter terrae]HEX2891789.1 hypothetical protein [Vineibacter terrae]